MKKLAALVLSFGMLFSMAACSGSKVSDDALDKLESSVKKFSEVKNANYSADMDMTVDKENAKRLSCMVVLFQKQRSLCS